MIWANLNEQRIKATPKLKAICPICKEEVKSKCGSIKIWHWAHISKEDCDNFAESETAWHKNWKEYFPKENQEVILENHRADIKNKYGLIVELQNSPLNLIELIKRETFYGNMVWILNGKTLGKNFIIKKYKEGTQYFFKWKWAPKVWIHATKTIYIDISDREKDILFKIEELNEEGTGKGRKNSKSAFLILNGGNIKNKGDGEDDNSK